VESILLCNLPLLAAIDAGSLGIFPESELASNLFDEMLGNRDVKVLAI